VYFANVLRSEPLGESIAQGGVDLVFTSSMRLIQCISKVLHPTIYFSDLTFRIVFEVAEIGPEGEMKTISAFLLATFMLLPLTIRTLAATPTPCSTCSYRGAPGPIVGAGLAAALPALGIGIGYVFWLRNRRRKAD
jgi:hypothetical protein